jgi:hypothetical protein
MDAQQRQLLILEYQTIQDGYKSRDQLVPQEFAYMLQVFFIFITLMTAAKAFLNFDRSFAVIVFLLLGLVGFIALSAFLIDLQANTSSKRALRQRGAEIEDLLGATNLQHWKTIAERQMHFEENLFKGPSRGKLEASAASAFVWSARLVVLVWVILVIVIVAWGHTLSLGGSS